ncbi:unnamed protein product, partial [Phaedon cochleariae]
RWQRRWFVLYDDGKLNYSVDEHPDTIPQGSVDMCQVLEVTGAEQLTGHAHSLALTSPDRVTFVKAASREDARWWVDCLAVFPRRHKRNATFPGGRASPSLPHLGRSASPQPPRPRHLSVTGPSPRTNFETPPLREREGTKAEGRGRVGVSAPIETPTCVTPPSSLLRPDYLMSSGSPPTRDKLRGGDKARVRRDWRNERLRDIATALTDRSPESSLALPAEGLLHLKKGWLWMKTSNSDWARRWIVLCCPTTPTLQIYRDQDEQSAPELSVELSSVTDCVEVPTESKYGFEVRWAGPTLTLSALAQGIRSNWLQALKKATPIMESTVTVESPISPSTPRSILASSDEEYRTASEGGRRGSEDWTDLPASPRPSALGRLKERGGGRPKPRLPRGHSRQSTLDSTSTDEMDCAIREGGARSEEEEGEAEGLRRKLSKAEEGVRQLEEEIARLKKFQSDAAIREKKAKEMLATLENAESALNQRNSQIELDFLKEQRVLQRRLAEAEESARLHEEKCDILTRDLLAKQRALSSLQEEMNGCNDRLAREREENDKLYKRMQELEGKYNFKNEMFNTDSIGELTNINLDLDIDDLNQNEIREYCLDLKGRFERAIVEIRAVKKALKECEETSDRFELANFSLTETIGLLNGEHEHEVKLLVQRLEHMTAKSVAAERQLKVKAKTEAKDKRRSLSLKGRESVSINKEVEDKVTELEAKILALERGKSKRRYKRDRSSERASPIDDKHLRRLRRKSLDSATSSEPMKLLVRLSTLESKVTNVHTSNESLNTLHGSISDLSKAKDEPNSDGKSNLDVDYLLSCAKLKVDECLQNVGILKSTNRRRSSSPSIDRLLSLENSLNELLDILNKRDCSLSAAETDVINTSATAVVKQLQTLLLDKLTSLAEKKMHLQENHQWDANARLEMLAEKVAYENILVSRIQEALLTAVNSETVCERLINKEIRETAYLIIGLQQKVNGTSEKNPLPCRTSVDYLSKVLAKCLVSASRGFKSCRNFVATKGPSLDLLLEEKQKLDTLLASHKALKLPQLAESLASETMSLTSDRSCRLRSLALTDETLNEFGKTARQVVNAELIRSEINHVLHRAAQIYRSNVDEDHTFFFGFFASEMAALELFADSVNEALYEEIDRSVAELTDLYQNCLNKLLKQNWRYRVELERTPQSSANLLREYAEVVAHKALIDARISVLAGKFSPTTTTTDNVDGRADTLASWAENEEGWAHLRGQTAVDERLEAEFACMMERFGRECYASVGQREMEEVAGYLDEMASKVMELRGGFDVPSTEGEAIILRSWSDICQKCIKLRNDLEEVRVSLDKPNTLKRSKSSADARPAYLATEYLTQVEHLRAAYRGAQVVCGDRAAVERLQQLGERVLQAMEQWHRRTVQEMREAHAQEVDLLKQEKDQALAEETQATLAALDAMRKAHVAEVQREVAKFKREFARQRRDTVSELSDRLSAKSLEAAALDERLGTATRQLAHAQQHISRLERNPQISMQ